MRQQIILIIALSSILCVALVVKVTYYPRLYGHNAYYFLSIFWICSVLVIIFSLNVLWHWFAANKTPEKQHNFITWPNRRKTFRIIYPAFIRPTLILDSADLQPKRNLEFQVIDLSQEGICFLDDGILGPMEQFSGRIVFQNGDQKKVSGHFIRKSGDHVSVQFSKSLDWSTLIAEQRRVISHMKPVK